MHYILLCWQSHIWSSGFEMFPSVLKLSVMVVITLQTHIFSLNSLFSNTPLPASLASLLEAHKR